MMIFTLITLYHAFTNDFFDGFTKRFSSIMGLFILFFFIFYMGMRPISIFFQDMAAYAEIYNLIQNGREMTVNSDYLFHYFMVYSTKIMSDKLFFFICSLFYILPCYLFSKKYAGTYWYFVFLIFVGSFQFWPYGTNGIRNGMATSMFILALYFYDRKILSYLIMAISLGIHSSLVIPIIAFAVSGIYKSPKAYLYIWLASIPLSLAGGSVWENLFGGLGFGNDTRSQSYLLKDNINKEIFAYTGFRWDFVFYSSFAVFAGYYYILKKKVKDKFYIHLWGTYMIANAFWILVIRANFSNRFAYLSWFLMAPVIAYPLLRYKLFPNQYRVVGGVIAVYYLFTYLMFLRG